MCSRGQAHRGLDRRRDLVHRVRAQHQHVRAGGLERAGGGGEQRAGGLPVAGVLQPLHLVEVQAVEDDPRRVQPAQLGLDRLVDLTVVRHGGFPAHAADQPDDLHALSRR